MAKKNYNPANGLSQCDVKKIYRVDVRLIEIFCHLIEIGLDELAINLDFCDHKNYADLLNALKWDSCESNFGRTIEALFHYGLNVNALHHNSLDKDVFCAIRTGVVFQRRYYRKWKKDVTHLVEHILMSDMV